MTIVSIPEYVQTVTREFESVQLHWVRCSVFPLPSRYSPVVISVVKDEVDRLEDFLKHYRNLGIERFVFVDNGSTDGGLEMLASQPDVDLCTKVGAFDWMLKQGWINSVIKSYGYDRWYIYVDADEQIVFEGCDQHSFADLTWNMERRGLSRVRGFLIDMYDAGPLMESDYKSGGSLIESFNWFDRDTYIEERYKEIMSVKGGPRQRIFGRGENSKFRPEMTKYPLFKLSPGELMANPHHIWPYGGNFESARYLGVLHFKFLPGLLGRIKKAIENKNYWDGSYEYQCYLKVLQAEPKLSLHFEGSERYQSADHLAEIKMISPVEWGDVTSTSKVARAAYRRRRQEVLARS